MSDRLPVVAPDPAQPVSPVPAPGDGDPVSAPSEGGPAPDTDDVATPSPQAAPPQATSPPLSTGGSGGPSIGAPTGEDTPRAPSTRTGALEPQEVPPSQGPTSSPSSRTPVGTLAGPTTAPPPVAAPAPPVEAVPVDPQRTVGVDQVVQEVFSIPEPEWVAAAGGAVWVKRDDGQLNRIDPATNQVVASVQPPADTTCSGLGGIGNVLWTCVGGGTVARIDPATNTEVARLDLNKVPDQQYFPMAFGHAWFLVDGGTRLVGVDHATNGVGVSVDLGSTCVSVDATDAALWAACPTDGVVLRVDPDTSTVTTRVEGLPGARTVSAGGYVWVGYDGGTARIDRGTGLVTGAVDTGPATDRRSLHTAGNLVFIRTPESFLQVLDATTLELLEEVTAPELTSGASLLAFGSLWTTSGEDGSLYRLATPAP